eukprot:PhF_6_TR21199/c0_g3_i1/m.30590
MVHCFEVECWRNDAEPVRTKSGYELNGNVQKISTKGKNKTKLQKPKTFHSSSPFSEPSRGNSPNTKGDTTRRTPSQPSHAGSSWGTQTSSPLHLSAFIPERDSSNRVRPQRTQPSELGNSRT